MNGARPVVVVFAPSGRDLPGGVAEWLARLGLAVVQVGSADELMSRSLRGRPRVVAFDAREDAGAAAHACHRMKSDSFTGIVPSVMIVSAAGDAFKAAFESGADEVVRPSDPAAEITTRLDALLRRSDRDLTVHPTTRLPGAAEIEADVQRRLTSGAVFAMCYADLDHFKEFNDRYSYQDGDRVIQILARILHDVVKGLCGEEGFVGHIGGDDFIFVTPVSQMHEACAEIIEVFDLLVPFQYSEPDRRAGYYFGKDRRGQLHRVPLMTLSIGVVTNERRRFSHAAQLSELATEMKSYAKTLPGSVFAIDRRTETGAAGDSDLQGRVSVHARVGDSQ